MAIILARPVDLHKVQQLIRDGQVKDRFKGLDLWWYGKLIFDVEELLATLILKNNDLEFIKGFLNIKYPCDKSARSLIDTSTWRKILDMINSNAQIAVRCKTAKNLNQFLDVLKKLEWNLNKRYEGSVVWGYNCIVEFDSRIHQSFTPIIAFNAKNIECDEYIK